MNFVHDLWPLAPRHWVLIAFIAAALHAHLRGKVRFGLVRALTDFTVLIAPFNSLMVLFSKVGSQPYLNDKQFPELKVLQDNWQLIRDEALALDEGGNIKAADGYNDIGFNSFFRTGWKRFYLKWYGPSHPSAKAMCPKTTALLESLPDVRAAMFAQLPSGSELRPHRDPFAGSLRLHLGLATPNNDACYIEVDGIKKSWRDGEWMMFDETYIHHAHNETPDDRVILFCDIARPLRFGLPGLFNRLVASTLLAGGASPNLPGDPTGGVNKAFGSVYKVRLKAKALRERSVVAYQVIKWGLVVAVIAGIWAL